jgi:hypothetical protein
MAVLVNEMRCPRWEPIQDLHPEAWLHMLRKGSPADSTMHCVQGLVLCRSGHHDKTVHCMRLRRP